MTNKMVTDIIIDVKNSLCGGTRLFRHFVVACRQIIFHELLVSDAVGATPETNLFPVDKYTCFSAESQQENEYDVPWRKSKGLFVFYLLKTTCKECIYPLKLNRQNIPKKL